jgi:hypothetical protein
VCGAGQMGIFSGLRDRALLLVIGGEFGGLKSWVV